MKFSSTVLVSLAMWGVSVQPAALAASFYIGTDIGGSNNLLLGQSTGILSSESTTATLSVETAGGLLDDSDKQGLGIDTRGVSGSNDNLGRGDRSKFNIFQGTNNSTGLGESLKFSFGKAGILNSILFDGIKDETLEYFQLTFPNGKQITIFDSQADFRLGLQNYQLTDLNVPNPIECQLEDDDLTQINYLFQAGEVFTLTYGEGNYADVPNYKTDPRFPQFPNAVGDGSRLQGFVVTLVPEPTSISMLLLTSGLLLLRRNSRETNNYSGISSPPSRLLRAK